MEFGRRMIWNRMAADPQARSIPVRKDDEVLIVRGKYKGREGKVTQVSTHLTAAVKLH